METTEFSCFFPPSDNLVLYLSKVGEAAPSMPMYYYHIPDMTAVKCKCIISNMEWNRMLYFG